jgi:HlyD family secretion protein
MESVQVENPRKIVHIDEVKPQRSRKSRRSALVGAIGVLVLAAAAGGSFFLFGSKSLPTVKGYDLAPVQQGDLTVTSSASGTVVLPQTISVTAPSTGYADKLYVKEGDTVPSGALLASLSVPDLQNTKLELQAQLSVAKITYDGLVVDWDYQIQTTKTALARIDDTIADAQKDADTKKELSTLKSSLATDYQTALDTLKADQQKKEDLAAQLANQLKKRDNDLAKQKASIDEIQFSLAKTQSDIDAARIKSPIAGEVLSIASALAVPQSLINQYTVLIKVADPSSTYIDLEVSETDASSLKVGDKLTLTVSAKTLVAAITSIGKVASLASDGLTSTVTVRVKPVDATTLTPGASAAATISLGTKKNALLLPRGAFLTTGSQKWVYVVDGTVAKKTAVTFGTLTANTVEVKSGLKAGDTVITSGYQDFIDQDQIQLTTTEGDKK